MLSLTDSLVSVVFAEAALVVEAWLVVDWSSSEASAEEVLVVVVCSVVDGARSITVSVEARVRDGVRVVARKEEAGMLKVELEIVRLLISAVCVVVTETGFGV